MAAPGSKSKNIHCVDHPIVSARLSLLRQSGTTPNEFREGIKQISRFLGFEASRTLESLEFDGETPVAPFTGTVVKPQIGLAPILRAGLGMEDAMLELFPDAKVYHIGMFREKISLQPVEYYSKLPPQVTVDRCFLLDPLVATGGTACATITMLLDWGLSIKNITLLAVLGSQPGLERITQEYPELEIWVGAVDKELTPNGIISPGLGDTGDRLFHTY